MKFIFPVAIYKDIEFEVTSDFMDFYKDFCQDSCGKLKAAIQMMKSTSYIPTYQEQVLKDYEILKDFSKEDIESALSSEYSKDWFDTLRQVIQIYLERKNDFFQDSCEWEPEYEIVEE